MNNKIAYCGLDCSTCEARIATINNDLELKEKVAQNWSKLNNTTITIEMINCLGCKSDGVKTPFCDSMCSIRKCAMKNTMNTCKDCLEKTTCEKLKMIISNNEDALNNIKD